MEGLVNNLDLFMVLREQFGSLSDSKNLFEYLKEMLNVNWTEETNNNLLKFCQKFCSNVCGKWERSNRTLSNFLKRNGDWLESAIIWPEDLVSKDVETLIPSAPIASTSSSQHTPRKPFEELSNKQKRRRVENLAKSVSPQELQSAAMKHFKSSGDCEVSKIMDYLLNHPEDIDKVKACINQQKEKCLYTPEKALALSISLNLSKWQYINLRDSAIEQGAASMYPSYYKIKQAKLNCYPAKEDITITEDGASIKLQALLNLTTFRLLDAMDFNLSSKADLKLISKWGFDGASSQSNYKQKASSSDFDDSSVFMVSLVPIRLMRDEEILWENNRPCSTFYCRPIQFKFMKECESSVQREKEAIELQIEALQPSELQEVTVKHQLLMTMIDGKITSYISETSTAVCDICKAKPSEMNKLEYIDRRTENKDMYQYGLSSLHAWIRCMECLLHIDVPITWSQSVRNASLPCVVPEWTRVQPRRPPPPLDDDQVRTRPFTWFRGTSTREEVTAKRISHDGTLDLVRKSAGTSEGVYQCAASQQGGLVLGYPVNLKFSYIGKQFLSPPTDMVAYLNQPLSIPCRISSGPAASISWTRDGRPLPINYRYYLLESELLITDVQNEDAGAYRCIATNSNVNKSRTSSEGRVSVIASKDEDPSFLPVHVEEHIAVPRGSRVVLPCPVTGWPRPKLRWELTPPGEKTSELESTEEVLVLNSLEYDQEGVYTCSLEDYLDMVKTFNVTMTEPVVITLPPASKDVTRASTVRFNCTASGRPEPNVTWYKNGEKLTLAGRRNLRSSVDRKRLELVISGVTSDDAGVYQCFAWNGHSMSSRWARLNVTGAGADAPRALACAPTAAAAVALRWLPPADKVMAYTVDTTPTDKHGGAITGQPHTNTEEIIKVREPLTPYLFQVRAYIPSSAKKNIASDMSESVLCQGQGVPIKLSKLEDDKILVSWKQFADQNPGVVEWILQYKPDDGTGDAPEHNITLAAHVTNYTLMAPESQPLRVRLLGSRTLDWLHQNLTLVPWTSTTAAGQDTDDGEVKVIPQDLEVTEVNERSFTLRWQCEDATRYTFLVCVRRVDGNDDCQESYETSTKIEGLQPDSKYEVRVQVRVPGRALGGAFTAPYFVTTLPKGPHRFKDLKYNYVNASAIRVSWSDAPARYTVYHSAELKLPVEQWAAEEIMGNTVLITGIEPTAETYVMVTGYEPLGHSPILNVPPQVRNLEGKDLTYSYTSSGVCVSWNGTGPRVVRFTQNITQPVENWSAVNVTGTSVELNDLRAGPVFVMVTAAGGERRRYPTPLTIPQRPPDHYYYYLGIGLGCGACALCALAGGALCWWRRVKAKRTPQRSRRTHTATAAGNEEEGSEMRTARVANGGAGEPLLNGHVHITENPASKTPNGRMKKSRRYEPPSFEAFDVSRHEPDTTAETVLDDTTSYSLLDTSRQPEYDLSRSSNLSANDSFNKLPDDNMNSELTRSTEFQLDNSKIQPTLQPNG